MAVWLLRYWYFLEQQGRMQKGVGRRAVALFFSGVGLYGLDFLLPQAGFIAWLFVLAVFLIYDLFFDEEPWRLQAAHLLPMPPGSPRFLDIH